MLEKANAYNVLSKDDLLEWSITKSKVESPCYVYWQIMWIKIEQDYNSNMEYYYLNIKNNDWNFLLMSLWVSNYYYESNINHDIVYWLYINNNIYDLKLWDSILAQINKWENYITYLENEVDVSWKYTIQTDFESIIKSKNVVKCEVSEIWNIDTNEYDLNNLYYYWIIICFLIIIWIVVNMIRWKK